MSIGYWSHNKYYRMNVEELVTEFCGWKPLIELIGHASEGRNQAFLTALFLTGGRVSEVLNLVKSNFIVAKDEGVILVSNMPLFKRYKKIAEYEDEEGHIRWETERQYKMRKKFPIKIAEPITPMLLEWLDQCNDLLFPSPYKFGEPLSRSWAYKMVRELGDTISKSLRDRLGLNKPLIKTEEGKRKEVKPRLNLWLHWWRSQRASQLVDNYGFQILDLIGFFSWQRQETALRYAKKGWRGLLNRMQATEITYV